MEQNQSDYGGIHERVVGQFPLSIATSLAIESACGIHPDLPPPASLPIRKYHELWINLRTLYRNFMGALPKNLVDSITVEEVVYGLVAEMHTIPDILKEYLGRPMPVIFYFSNYRGMESKYPQAALRRDNTPKQISYTAMLTAVMEIMLKHHSAEFLGFDLKLRGNAQAKTAIITHYAYDLLSQHSFGSLTLLESHTGKFKDRALWNSKYHNAKDLTMMPFREDLMQVFGDQETFQPLDIKLRRALIEIATKRLWSAVTTKERIVSSIDELQNPLHKAILKEMLV